MSDAPQIQDDPGRADERFARAILALPWLALVALIAGVVGAVLTGAVSLDISIAGTLSARYLIATFVKPIVYVAGAALLGVYVLAAAKEWGIAPVQWLANAARDYQPHDRDDDA